MIHVGKTGVFSALGHEHEVRAPIQSGMADTTKIELRIVALPVIGRSLGAWWHGLLSCGRKSLHETCRLLIQLQDHFW